MEVFEQIFGEGRELTSLQMSLRAVVMFVVAVVLIKVAGIKTFGKNATFDNIVVIMLGAILSRGVAGVSPFLPVIFSGLTLVLMNRLFSVLSRNNQVFERWVKGAHLSLYKDGKVNEKNLRRSLLSESDLMEGVRKEVNINSLDSIEEIFIESSGDLSVIKRELRP